MDEDSARSPQWQMEIRLSIRRGYLRYLTRRFIQVGHQSGWRVAISRAAASLQSEWQELREIRTSKPGCSYPEWIRQNEELEPSNGAQKELAFSPRLCVLLPVRSPHAARVRDTIASLQEQSYPHWRLCLLAPRHRSKEMEARLVGLPAEDTRIHIEWMEAWSGSAAALNTALEHCQADYFLVMSQGDELAPNALFEIAALLNEQPGLDLVYFDEDRVSKHGKVRHSPWFKPSSFSPALLLSVNYLTHAAIRRELAAGLGGYDSQIEGAHEWDLAFRCVESTQKIGHIPKVLYHESGRGSEGARGIREAELACIAAHLRRQDPLSRDYQVSSLPSGVYRARMPVSDRLVSIIIPSKDKLEWISACLASILDRTTYPNYEILLVDTGSTQAGVLDYYRELESNPRFRLIRYTGPFNYSAANNLGASMARGSFLLFLNNDTRILNGDWLDELVGWGEQPGVGVVGGKLMRPDGTIQHAGLVLGLAGHASHVYDGYRPPVDSPFGSADWYRNYLAVTGACMLVSREVFEASGGYDTRYRIGYSDIEFCLRVVRSGYQVVYTPFAALLHNEGETRGLGLPPSDVLRAAFHFLPVLRSGDPNFNPNLSYLSRKPQPVCQPEESRQEHVERILLHYGLVSIARYGSGFMDGFQARHPATEWPLFPLDSLDAHPRPEGRRLLLVSHDFSQSGAPRVLFKLALYLQDHGYTVRVLSPTDGPLKESYLQAGIDAQVIDGLLEDARLLLERLAAHDFLLANTILSWRAVHAARALGKPAIWWIHEAEAGRDLARFREPVASAFTAARRVVFPVQYTANLYSPFIAAGNFETIHPGIDLDAGNAASQPPPGQDTRTFKLVAVGSIEPRKGQDLLLKALVKLPPEIRQHVTCTFIGRPLDPAYGEKLSRMVARLRLQGVEFTGELPSQMVHSYLLASDVFLLPSRGESLPVALLEAMALGKAVIAASVGGVPEVLEGGCGLSFPAGDVRALADQIAHLYNDRSAVSLLGERARRAVQERFTFEAFARRMLTLVEEAFQPVTHG